MNEPIKIASLGMIIPALINPLTATIAVGAGLLWLLSDDEEEKSVKAEPIKLLPPPTVKPTQTFQTVYQALPDEITAITKEPTAKLPSQAAQKEIIRKAMSEPGKRSAKARAIKKAQAKQEC